MANKHESAQEEFQRRVKELYALADKMGLLLTVTVRRQKSAMAGKPSGTAGTPAEADSPRRRETQSRREPGES